MRKNIKFLTTVTTLLLTVGCLFAQDSNVRVQQRTDGSLMVDIYYDFINPNGYDTEIAIIASGDNGATWELACSSSNQTGDVGEDITAGTNKHIVWDFYADHPNTSASQFKVRILHYFFSTMTGNDGTVYKTVKIGDQWWMAENLRETQYRDGSYILPATDVASWQSKNSQSIGAKCVYNNIEANALEYGYLYNWHVVDPANPHDIAPAGWHVPTDNDWKELEMYLGMTQEQVDATGGFRGADQGDQLRSTSTNWYNYQGYPASNKSGFTSEPSGYRWYVDHYRSGEYSGAGQMLYLWTSSNCGGNNAWSRGIEYNLPGIGRYEMEKGFGQSIRLIKD